jgi:anaerobic selenocysteine-containing dehydrogenase
METATLLVVLDQQPGADALHAHYALPVFSFVERDAAIFQSALQRAGVFRNKLLA